MAEVSAEGRRRASLGEGVATLHAALLRFARYRRCSTADDHAQDVWADVLARGIPEDVADDTARLQAWLLGTLRHKIQDAARRRDLLGELLPPGLDAPAVDIDPADGLIRRETADAVRATLAQIATGRGRDYARCLALRYLDGLSLDEIAAKLGCTIAQATARLQRSKRAFRRAWRGGGGLAASPAAHGLVIFSRHFPR
ncbi:MAG: sigma-70 family RNA polymerase sigma factor [Gemmataceae bacterium]|nr:sigma-70 family RNA polymerase sigma factor [Gemmataceae bacterium]